MSPGAQGTAAQLTDAGWYRITSAARELFKTRMRQIDEGARDWWADGHWRAWRRREQERAAVDYSRTILGAYAAYRPSGPLEGEVVPSEVVRLRALELGHADPPPA